MNFIKIIRERKIINGSLYRRYFIDSKGNAVGIPIGITTFNAKGQNYVSNSNLKCTGDIGSCAIPYKDAATQEAAYLKMIKINETVTHGAIPTAPKADKRKKIMHDDFSCGYDKSKLPTGVNLHHLVKTKRVVINVSYFDKGRNKFHNKQLYVGTFSNWESRVEQVIQKGIELRESSLVIYNELTNQVTENA